MVLARSVTLVSTCRNLPSSGVTATGVPAACPPAVTWNSAAMLPEFAPTNAETVTVASPPPVSTQVLTGKVP